MTLAPDGTRLAYSRGRAIRNIFRAPILSERVATWDDAEQITFDEAQNEHFDLSPDGTTLLVSSDRSGNPDRRCCMNAGNSLIPLILRFCPKNVTC